MSDRLLTVTELAEYLGVPKATVYGWRYKGEGPRGYRIGKHVRYRREDVEAWLEERADDPRHVGLSGWARAITTPHPVRNETSNDQ